MLVSRGLRPGVKLWFLYRLDFPSGKSYHGITDSLKRRLGAHRQSARVGGPNLVHRAIRAHGEDSIDAVVLVAGSREYILDLEQKAIAAFGTLVPGGYNISPGGDSPPTAIPELRERIADAAKARWADPEKREAFLKIGRERGWHTPESRVKMAAAISVALKAHYAEHGHPSVGRVVSAETRAKLSNAARADHAKNPGRLRGRIFSAETRAKMSASAKAKAPSSVETRAKISAAASERLWMTDGYRSFLVHRRVPLPHGWRYGRARKEKAA